MNRCWALYIHKCKRNFKVFFHNMQSFHTKPQLNPCFFFLIILNVLGGIPNLLAMSFFGESPFCTLWIISYCVSWVIAFLFLLWEAMIVNNLFKYNMFVKTIIWSQIVYKHTDNTNNQLLWKPPGQLIMMSSSIHVLHVIECEITIIHLANKGHHLLIYLENSVSEIRNFDFVINVEIYVWTKLWGTEKLFAIAVNSL